MNEEDALLSENNPILGKLLFSVVGMIDKNGIIKLVSSEEKYVKFISLLAELRMAVSMARETKNIPYLVDHKFK